MLFGHAPNPTIGFYCHVDLISRRYTRIPADQSRRKESLRFCPRSSAFICGLTLMRLKNVLISGTEYSEHAEVTSSSTNSDKIKHSHQLPNRNSPHTNSEFEKRTARSSSSAHHCWSDTGPLTRRKSAISILDVAISQDVGIDISAKAWR